MIAHWVRTEGAWLSEPMPQRSGRRLVVACTDDRPCRGFLTWLFEAAPGARSGHSAEPFSYGYWQLRIVDEDREHERLQEKTSDGSEFVSWIRNAPSYWHAQHEACDRARSPFAPPRLDQLVAISEGVLSSEPVEGVRYNAPDHMTGWYLTTDKYDGDVSTLVLEHVVHVTHARPDLAPLIALAPGFRFWSGPPAEAWYDPKAAAAE